jgi:hypothetical protein
MPIIDKGTTVIFKPSVNVAAVAPPGGTIGQVLAKIDGDDYNYEWVDLPEPVSTGSKVYRALLTQTGTNAPFAIVLENTLGGPVVWSRLFAGYYTITLTGGFPNPLKVFPRPIIGNSTNGAQNAYMGYNDINSLSLITTNNSSTFTDIGSEDIYTLIEILVYP